MLVYWEYIKFLLSPVKLYIGGLQQTALFMSDMCEHQITF